MANIWMIEILADPRCAESLKVPIYIHPRDPSPQLGGALAIPGYLIGWGWALEVGTHAIRLMASGAFDEFPNLKNRHRAHGRVRSVSASPLDNRYTRDRGPKRKLSPSEYFKRHFFVTTSGMNYSRQLVMTVEEFGGRSGAVRGRLALRAFQGSGRGP
jgi:hypothetical protein